MTFSFIERFTFKIRFLVLQGHMIQNQTKVHLQGKSYCFRVQDLRRYCIFRVSLHKCFSTVCVARPLA